MNLPSKEELKNIYEHLQDDESRKIYRHRLLYSFFGEREDIIDMISEGELFLRENARLIDSYCKKIVDNKYCLYGSGSACDILLDYYIELRNVPFIVDTYKRGSFRGIPVISFEEFIKREDYKTYKVLIAVGTRATKEEIETKLSDAGVETDWLCPHGQFVTSKQAIKQYFDLPELKMGMEYFVDVGALD